MLSIHIKIDLRSFVDHHQLQSTFRTGHHIELRLHLYILHLFLSKILNRLTVDLIEKRAVIPKKNVDLWRELALSGS